MFSSSQLSLNSLPGSGHWTISDDLGRRSSSTESAVSATDCLTYSDLAESINKMQICPYMTQENYASFISLIVSRTSEELRLLNHMNHPSHRPDPWNPAPYLLCTLDRDEADIYACFEELTPYDQPPFRTVAHYLDFFRQLLEVAFIGSHGLTFLHELSIVNLNCAKRSSFMIDLSAGSSTSIPCSLTTSASQPPPYLASSHSVPVPIPDSSLHSTTDPSQLANTPLADQDIPSTTPNNNKGPLFDRAKFPVKYYIVDYSDAVQLSYHSSACHPSASDGDQDQYAQNTATNTPSPPLVSAMITGELTADGTRRLFEALCHTLEASVFDVSVPLPCPAPDAYTRSSGSSSSSSSDI
ncbi:hypothetical protein JOM56_010185 [Amanita muscaria]